MPKILIPGAVKRYTGGFGEVEVGGSTVREAIKELTEKFPDVASHLYRNGELRSSVLIYLKDENIRSLQGLETPVQPNDELSLVPAVAGGAGVASSAGPLIGDTSGPLPELNSEEVMRYSRHLIMPEVGMIGQKRLKEASVLCIGTGGLGSPVSLYLSAAGVGRMGLVDFDVVDFTNLHRQVIHFTGDVGKPKLQSAAEKIAQINPNVKLDMHETLLTSDNAMEILGQYDLIVDGTDNFPTRYLVNDACVLLGKPYVYGSIFRFDGMATVFDASKGPCYRCLHAEPPAPGEVPSCAEGGVLGILPGLVGLIQATEAIKLIIGQGEPLIGRLLLIDALSMKFRELKLRKDPACPICGSDRTIHELIDYNEFCGIPTHEEESLESEWETSPQEVKSRLDRGDSFEVVDVRNPEEWEICHIDGARLIPLGDLLNHAGELPMDRDIVLHCKSGVRSAKALKSLRDLGFKRLKNMRGGILAWADEVDPSLSKY